MQVPNVNYIYKTAFELLTATTLQFQNVIIEQKSIWSYIYNLCRVHFYLWVGS